MQNTSIFKDYPYLNRLALTTDDDTSTIDPYSIITDFFYFGSIAEIKDLFMESCRASLSEKYSWKEGSPGNLLYFYEILEKLVEACFLLFKDANRKKKLSKKIKYTLKKKLFKDLCLPCSLSADEISDPFLVIHSFFALQTIKQWKQAMYAWMEAGLSNYTVMDSIETKYLLPYNYHLQKLLDACWYISIALKKINK